MGNSDYGTSYTYTASRVDRGCSTAEQESAVEGGEDVLVGHQHPRAHGRLIILLQGAGFRVQGLGLRVEG